MSYQFLVRSNLSHHLRVLRIRKLLHDNVLDFTHHNRLSGQGLAGSCVTHGTAVL